MNETTSRRTFLDRTGKTVLGAATVGSLTVPATVHAAGSDTMRIGLIGCGGRGSGAAVQALRADANTKLVAMADAFEDRMQASLRNLKRTEVAKRVDIPRDRQFIGLDAYQQLLATDVDVVILATPPGFRPLHLEAAVKAGKHVFAEKPAAVDAAGVHRVLAASRLAKTKGLFVVAGLQGRYEPVQQDTISRLHDGAIGDITAMRMVRYGGGVWVRPREPKMTDVEYQMRNWYYFTWLSGDFLVEQFVHEIDRMAWIANGYPVRCLATGGRQSRTGKNYGHIYDHFAALFTFEGGADLYASTRHQRGCTTSFDMVVHGTRGTCTGRGKTSFEISGSNAWKTGGAGKKQNGHQLEHNAMYKALRGGDYINNGDYLAKSTLMAIMARESAYTGQEITWEQMENSKQDLVPDDLHWNSKLPEWEVAIPGVTRFV